MSSTWQLEYESAVTTRDRVLAGTWSALDVTRAYLERITARDGALRSYLLVNAEGAEASARALDDRLAEQRRVHVDVSTLRSMLPLAGVTVGVKDALSTRGMRTTCGSKMLEQYVPPFDAHVVERLHATGAIVLGKTNMDEFAMGSSTEHSAYGPTMNPWDLERAPGGSSGGSASAVAAGLCHVALGTDTGGSVRQPASFTGTVGLKPTYGRVSRYGLIAFASSLDVVGPMARSVEDTALLFEAIAGHDARDSTCVDRAVETMSTESAKSSALRGLRVGIPEEYFSAGLDASVAASVRSALDALAAEGAELVQVSMPHTRYGVSAYYVLAPAEASSNLARFDGVRYGERRHGPRGTLDEMYGTTRDRGFGAEVKRRILLGTFALSAGYYDAYYGRAQRVRTKMRDDFTRAFERVDVLATPTSPVSPFRLGEHASDPLAMYLADVCTIPASLAGVPAMSIPCGLDALGLPVGLQFLAPPFAETRLLSVSLAAQQRLGRVTCPGFDDPSRALSRG